MIRKLQVKPIQKIIVSFMIAFAVFKADAQQVVSSSGGTFVTENSMLDFTIGEICTETLGTSQLIITQGFQQPFISDVNVAEIQSIGLNVYPNPAQTELYIELKQQENKALTYAIYSITGKLLKNESISNLVTSVNVDAFVPGTYVLQVSDKRKNIETYKIIKQ